MTEFKIWFLSLILNTIKSNTVVFVIKYEMIHALKTEYSNVPKTSLYQHHIYKTTLVHTIPMLRLWLKSDAKIPFLQCKHCKTSLACDVLRSFESSIDKQNI